MFLDYCLPQLANQEGYKGVSKIYINNHIKESKLFLKTCEAYKKALWPFNVLEFEMSNDDVYNSLPWESQIHLKILR